MLINKPTFLPMAGYETSITGEGKIVYIFVLIFCFLFRYNVREQSHACSLFEIVVRLSYIFFYFLFFSNFILNFSLGPNFSRAFAEEKFANLKYLHEVEREYKSSRDAYHGQSISNITVILLNLIYF